MQKKEELSKDEKMSREFNRIKRILKDIPKNRKDAALSLMKNAAFMTVTLDDLQDEINEKGCISTYQNGENQWGTKKSPEVEVYNAMIKNHSSIIKQLTDLIPGQDDSNKKEDELMEFIKKPRTAALR